MLSISLIKNSVTSFHARKGPRMLTPPPPLCSPSGLRSARLPNYSSGHRSMTPLSLGWLCFPWCLLSLTQAPAQIHLPGAAYIS